MIYKSSVAPHCLVLLHLSCSLHLDNQDFICLLMENICNNSHLMSTSSPSYPGHVSFKEMFILFLFFLLLMYSVLSFLHNWNKNYRSINHLPYYSTFINASEIGINKMELLQSQAPVDWELSGSSASARHGTFDIKH